MNQQTRSTVTHLVHANTGADYEKEVDRATNRKLYIPVVIDDAGGRHRLEQLGCRKAETALTIAAQARAEVLAKLAADAEAKAEVQQPDVDAAVLAQAQVA